MPVGVDGYFDKIRIVEGASGLRVGLFIEIPGRRPQPQQKSAKATAIISQACPAALGVKIVLVPIAKFILRRLRFDRTWNVLDGVTSCRHKPARTLRPKSSYDTCGPSSPIISGKHGTRDLERIHLCKQIMSQDRLLTRARGVRR